MYLEHVNLVVKSIDRSLAFYRAAFPHWWVRTEGKGEWYGKLIPCTDSGHRVKRVQSLNEVNQNEEATTQALLG